MMRMCIFMVLCQFELIVTIPLKAFIIYIILWFFCETIRKKWNFILIAIRLYSNNITAYKVYEWLEFYT